jgi:hypothetical protein
MNYRAEIETINGLQMRSESEEIKKGFRKHYHLQFHRKLPDLKNHAVRRQAAPRPTYFQWKTGCLVSAI